MEHTTVITERIVARARCADGTGRLANLFFSGKEPAMVNATLFTLAETLRPDELDAPAAAAATEAETATD